MSDLDQPTQAAVPGDPDDGANGNGKRASWHRVLTASMSSVQSFLQDPNASSRLVADLEEWTARRLKQATPEGVDVEQASFAPLGGAVLVSSLQNPDDVVRVAAGDVQHRSAPFKARASSPCPVPVVRAEELVALFSLFQTARVARAQLRAELRNASPRHHHLWIHADPAWKELPLAACAHLLASSLAVQFDEAAVVLEIEGDGSARIGCYRGTTFRDCGVVAGPATEKAVLAHLEKDPDCRSGFYHFLHLCPDTPPEACPAGVPGGSYEDGFDRIVHLTRTLDLHEVSRLSPRLKEAARNVDEPFNPYFTSFIPTLVNGDRAQFLRRLRPAGFDRLLENPAERPPGWRLLRDACWIELDVEAVAACWRDWASGRREAPFAAGLSSDSRASLERWARAVTNRQVGLALSGGGASSYRFIPVIERFARPDAVGKTDGIARPSLPIDVVSGVSGGALIGAYLCDGGVEGCRRAVDDGPPLQVSLLGFSVLSTLLEWFLDARFGRRSVASLPVRFVPVAVCLMRGEPPETRVLVNFTVGESVRASGSLPMVFGPSNIRGEYYADGAFGTIIPAQAVSLYGADLVIAVNCIAGPALGDPYARSALFRTLRRWTLVGRLVDLWISVAYLQQEASRLVRRTIPATVLIEPTPAEGPFEEMAAFGNAAAIVEKARRDDRFMASVESAVGRWNSFRDFGAGQSGTMDSRRGEST